MTGNIHGLNIGGIPAVDGGGGAPELTQEQLDERQRQQELADEQRLRQELLQQQQQQQQQQPPLTDLQVAEARAQSLAAQVEQLQSALAASQAQARAQPPGAPLFDMFTAQPILDVMRSKEGSRKAIAPIIKGFKADALAGPLPPKIDALIAEYKYLPYSALTRAARAKALKGEEAVIITASGFAAKGIDRSGERTITPLDWMDAARVHLERTRFHHGDAHADSLEGHQKNILSLGARQGVQGAEGDAWLIAVAYDIHQREAAAANPAHDLAPLDTAALQLVTNQFLLARSVVSASMPMHSAKRGPQGMPAALSSPAKRSRPSTTPSSRCFRCGGTSHLPRECTETKTRAGKDVAAVSTDPRHPNSLSSVDGKIYCFRWSRDSSCGYGAEGGSCLARPPSRCRPFGRF